LRVSLLAVEKSGVPHGADAYAAALVGDLRAESGTFVAVSAEETELHQFVAIQSVLKLLKEGWRESGSPDLECGI
jgi:hypothetical protein